MNNPFEAINQRLSNIESLLLDIKHKPEPEDKPEYLTVKEAVPLLKVSEQSIIKYIKKGLLPAKFIGRRYLIARVDMEAALKEHKSLKYKRS
jgi:excisionase family DNA binding protein